MKHTDMTQLPASDFFGAVENMLSDGYDVEFTVTGNSMWPVLRHGRDRVIISSYGDKKIQPGDTVLYCPIREKYLLHRIMFVKNGNFRAAGDNNCFYDGNFSTDCIVGRVTTYIRKEKKYSADSFAMRTWSFCWRVLFPIRKTLLWLLRKRVNKNLTTDVKKINDK
ncbi:MAG: S24/S26 family peptidase [Clostridia bacterium]|nr:S24/S26 family peptidase [Clostridia bacterium]